MNLKNNRTVLLLLFLIAIVQISATSPAHNRFPHSHAKHVSEITTEYEVQGEHQTSFSKLLAHDPQHSQDSAGVLEGKGATEEQRSHISGQSPSGASDIISHQLAAVLIPLNSKLGGPMTTNESSAFSCAQQFLSKETEHSSKQENVTIAWLSCVFNKSDWEAMLVNYMKLLVCKSRLAKGGQELGAQEIIGNFSSDSCDSDRIIGLDDLKTLTVSNAGANLETLSATSVRIVPKNAHSSSNNNNNNDNNNSSNNNNNTNVSLPKEGNEFIMNQLPASQVAAKKVKRNRPSTIVETKGLFDPNEFQTQYELNRGRLNRTSRVTTRRTRKVFTTTTKATTIAPLNLPTTTVEPINTETQVLKGDNERVDNVTSTPLVSLTVPVTDPSIGHKEGGENQIDLTAENDYTCTPSRIKECADLGKVCAMHRTSWSCKVSNALNAIGMPITTTTTTSPNTILLATRKILECTKHCLHRGDCVIRGLEHEDHCFCKAGYDGNMCEMIASTIDPQTLLYQLRQKRDVQTKDPEFLNYVAGILYRIATDQAKLV